MQQNFSQFMACKGTNLSAEAQHLDKRGGLRYPRIPTTMLTAVWLVQPWEREKILTRARIETNRRRSEEEGDGQSITVEQRIIPTEIGGIGLHPVRRLSLSLSVARYLRVR